MKTQQTGRDGANTHNVVYKTKPFAVLDQKIQLKNKRLNLTSLEFRGGKFHIEYLM